MRQVYVTHEPWPASAEVIASAGGVEILHTTDLQPGLHDLAEPGDDLTPPDPKQILLAQVAALRLQKQSKTAIAPGAWIDSDDIAIGRITAKIRAMELGGMESVQWKVGLGQYVTLTLNQLKATGLAIDAHWVACFEHEAVLAAAVLADETPDIESGWP